MYKILVLRVISILSLLGSTLFALDYPLDRVIRLEIKNNTMTVLEFPFIIKAKKSDLFKRVKVSSSKKQIKLDKNKKIQVPKFETTTKIINGKKIVVKKYTNSSKGVKSGKGGNSKKRVFKVTSSKNGNIMELIPRALGVTKIIIWGYSHYPIMLHIKVVADDMKNKDHEDYYNFIDFKNVKQDVIDFESSRHENVIKKLLKYAYIGKVPRGYKIEYLNKVEQSDFYKIKLISTSNGKKYGIKSYEITNTSKEEINLTNEMFYKQGYIYSVSIEKLNKALIPNEKTRLFIVHKYVHEIL